MSYLPSTAHLAAALAKTLPPWRSQADECYLLHQWLVDLSSQAYSQLEPSAYQKGTWPAPEAPVLQALRGALADHPQDEAGTFLAHVLVRYGSRDAETMNALHPWDRLMFTWQSRAYTVDSLAAILGRAGLECVVTEEGRATLEARLANPLDHLGDCWVTFFLLEGRAVYQSLRDVGFEPAHHQLFEALCRSVGLDLSEVSQRCDRAEVLVDTGQRLGDVALYTSEGGHWVIAYQLEGRARHFLAEARGTWMDVAAVRSAFDDLMQELGRPERCFQFAFGRGENHEHGAFLAAHRELFEQVAGELGLPLEAP